MPGEVSVNVSSADSLESSYMVMLVCVLRECVNEGDAYETRDKS